MPLWRPRGRGNQAYQQAKEEVPHDQTAGMPMRSLRLAPPRCIGSHTFPHNHAGWLAPHRGVERRRPEQATQPPSSRVPPHPCRRHHWVRYRNGPESPSDVCRGCMALRLLPIRMLCANMSAGVKHASTDCTRSSSRNVSLSSSVRSVAGCTITCWRSAVMRGSSARNRYACRTNMQHCPCLRLSDRAGPGSSRKSCKTWPSAVIWHSRHSFAV